MNLRNQNDNLFEDSKMSFGEHLEELRKVLIRSLVGVAVGCFFGFLLAETVVDYLQGPLENALTNFYIKDAKKELRDEQGYLPPELLSRLDESRQIPDTVWVDPRDFRAMLSKLDPDFEQDSISMYFFFCR